MRVHARKPWYKDAAARMAGFGSLSLLRYAGRIPGIEDWVDRPSVAHGAPFVTAVLWAVHGCFETWKISMLR
jgi:hypothetical protein